MKAEVGYELVNKLSKLGVKDLGEVLSIVIVTMADKMGQSPTELIEKLDNISEAQWQDSTEAYQLILIQMKEKAK